MANKKNFMTCDGNYAAAHIAYMFSEVAAMVGQWQEEHFWRDRQSCRDAIRSRSSWCAPRITSEWSPLLYFHCITGIIVDDPKYV